MGLQHFALGGECLFDTATSFLQRRAGRLTVFGGQLAEGLLQGRQNRALARNEGLLLDEFIQARQGGHGGQQGGRLLGQLIKG